MPGMSTIVLLILSIFKVGEMAHLGGKNSLPTVHPPAQIQQNSFLQQTALKSHPPMVSNNNPFGGDAIIGIKEVRPLHSNDAINSLKKDKNTSRKLKENVEIGSKKKGVKVGGKVKLQRQNRKSKKVPQRGRIGVILFYVFMLINMLVPHVPQNVMIRHNNHFVPIEKEFVACQPLANATGYQCEFSLDEMMLESNKTNVEIWANFGEDNDGTLRLLGQQDASKCNADEDGQAQCDTKLVINSDQIDQLKSISMDEVNDAILQSNKDAEVHRRQLGEGEAQNRIAVCNVGAAQPPSSLFEWTFKNGQSLDNNGQSLDNNGQSLDNNGQSLDYNGQSLAYNGLPEEIPQFYDVSYVDGFNVPISVFVKDCPGVHIAKNFTFNSLLASLPAEMKDLTYNSGQDLVGVQSVCEAYGTDAVCCRKAYGGPDNCKPDTAHGWEQKQVDAYNAMLAAFPDAYNYAYDDKTAIKKCNGATDYHIGICTHLIP